MLDIDTSDEQSFAIFLANGPQDDDRWREWRTDAMGELRRLAGVINSLEYDFIKLLGRFDLHECWAGEGVKSLAHWLNWKCGISTPVAREKVRVARCLRELPLIDEAFRAGRISYSKVRALTRAATADNEALMLEEALRTTAAHLEQWVRRFARVPEPGVYGAEAVERMPYLAFAEDDDGMVRINARLPAEDGMLVQKAVERMINTATPETSADSTKECGLQAKSVSAEARLLIQSARFGRRRASALVRIAEHYLGGGPAEDSALSNADKYQIVVHVNVNDAHRDCQVSGGECTYLEDGHFIAPEVAKRLACQASVTTIVEDDDGNVLNIGRRSRMPTRAIELAVDARDNGTCQFPSCHQTRYTDQHHIIGWADGGETSVRNLITLCRYHHTRQHEGEYSIERVDDVPEAARDSAGDGNGSSSDKRARSDNQGYRFIFIDRHGDVIERGMDPQFPPAREISRPVRSQVRTKLVGSKAERVRASLRFYEMMAE